MKGWVPSFFVVWPSYIEKNVIYVKIKKRKKNLNNNRLFKIKREGE